MMNDFFQSLDLPNNTQTHLKLELPESILEGTPDTQKIACLKTFEFIALHISEEEKAAEKLKILENKTFNALRRGDQSIVSAMKKRRGRKRFIFIDNFAH